MNTPSSVHSPGSSVGSGPGHKRSETSEGRSTKRGVDDLIRWALVANKVTGEERLAEEAKKVLAADMMTSLRRLTDDLNDDEWMYDPPNLGDGGRWKNRR